ncbi:MAG TPA: nickel pincer cofactor biosynthesis protein LarC [Pirellulaceae bacterium]|nr:nickel pincer cofactor biosynthesis protein LarC [Pirellulaceae bacterium]
MKIAYFDCLSGISGDMTLGALVDCGVELATLQAGIDSLGFPNIKLASEEVKRRGFRAAKVKVLHEPEHAHRHLHHITEKIDASSVLTPPQKDLARRIFTCIGEAEAKVHGTTIRKVHFHEVGAVDSIADIVGCAVGLSLLAVDRIVCSPVPTGTGHIEIEHGRVSVPAPATAEILRGVPLAPSAVPFELTTPTGAAIVKTVADEFGPLPAMTIQTIGLGAGDRDLKEQPNVLRLILGEAAGGMATDQIWVLETNLDDISGEIIGHTTARLFEAGALDVYTTSIQMKKNRPGVLLSVLCPAELLAKMEKIIFKETSTLGIRRWQVARHKLERRPHTIETPLGPIEGKLAVLPDGGTSFSPEFEACRRIATEKNVPLKDVYEAAMRASGGSS